MYHLFVTFIGYNFYMSKKLKRIMATFGGLTLVCLVVVINVISVISTTKIEKYVPPEVEISDFLDYDENCFWNNGFLKYEDTKYSSLSGIDVSEFQDHIDWKMVKEDGVDFAFLRIGRRGATTGSLYLDSHFEENYKGAYDNAIPIGIYFFSQAINDKEIEEEVNFVVDNLKGKTINLPIAFDLEEVYLPDETPRANGMSKEEKTARALYFCKLIEKHGYKAIIYTGLSWSIDSYDMETLSDYPIWFAQYGVDYPELDRPFIIWQYSESGKVNGISEPVDINIMFIRKNGQTE